MLFAGETCCGSANVIPNNAEATIFPILRLLVFSFESFGVPDDISKNNGMEDFDSGCLINAW